MMPMTGCEQYTNSGPWMPGEPPPSTQMGGATLPGRPPKAPRAPAAASAGLDPLVQAQLQWQAEMVRAIERLSKKDGDDDSSGDEGACATDKAFRGICKLRHCYEQRPERVIEAYVSRVCRELGVVRGSQFYQMSDYTKRVQQQFGKFRGLLRVHFAVAEAFQEWRNGRQYHVGASLCMMLQAVHQCVLDSGDWSSVQMLLPLQDHLCRPEFGGEHVAMAEIAR
jgi:hypothetical protein